jgi:hypothetical protein
VRKVLVAACLLFATEAQAEPFELVSRGPIAGANIGMSRAGYTLLFDLGGQSAGIRSFAERRLLLSWDVMLTARAGQLANTEPYVTLFGVRGASFVEPAYRTRESAWSPVISGRLGADAIALFHPGVSLSELHTLNDMDGAAGLFARGLVRAGFGASYLESAHSLLLQAFVQERMQTGGVFDRARAFTQLGFSARWDWLAGLAMYLEGTWGKSATRSSPALARTDRTTRVGLAGNVRKTFGGWLWVALSSSIDRDTDHVVYGGRTSFDTADPADFTLGLSLGASSLGSKR